MWIGLFVLLVQNDNIAQDHRVKFSETSNVYTGDYRDINKNADHIPKFSVMVYEDGSRIVEKDPDSELFQHYFQVPQFPSRSSVPFVVRTQKVGDRLWVINGDELWTSSDGHTFSRSKTQWTFKHQEPDSNGVLNIHSIGALFREEIWVEDQRVLLNNPLRLSGDYGMTFRTPKSTRPARPLLADPGRFPPDPETAVKPPLKVDTDYPVTENFLGIRPEEQYCFGLHQTVEKKWRIYCLDVVESVQFNCGGNGILRYNIHEAATWEDFIDHWEETLLEEKEQFYAGGRLAHCQLQNGYLVFSYPDGSGCQRETRMPSWSISGYKRSNENANCFAPPHLTTWRMSQGAGGIENWAFPNWVDELYDKPDRFRHRNPAFAERISALKQKFLYDRLLKSTGKPSYYKYGGSTLVYGYGGTVPDYQMIDLEAWIKGSWDPKERVFSFFKHSSGDVYFHTSMGLRRMIGDPTDDSKPKARIETVHSKIRNDCFSSRIHLIKGQKTRILACEGGDIWICPNDNCKEAYALKLKPPTQVPERRFQIFDTEVFNGSLYFGTSWGLIKTSLD